MRTFVAIDTPLPRAEGEAFPRAETHLTLKFLGEIDPVRAGAVADSLGRAVRGLRSFSLVLRSVGVFPHLARPRVVWAGVAAGGAELQDLRLRVDRELTRDGFPADPRPFVPHATLFRVRSRADADRARRLARDFAEHELGRTIVREVHLKESVLTPERAVHRSLARLSLEPVAPAP